MEDKKYQLSRLKLISTSSIVNKKHKRTITPITSSVSAFHFYSVVSEEIKMLGVLNIDEIRQPIPSFNVQKFLYLFIVPDV